MGLYDTVYVGDRTFQTKDTEDPFLHVYKIKEGFLYKRITKTKAKTEWTFDGQFTGPLDILDKESTGEQWDEYHLYLIEGSVQSAECHPKAVRPLPWGLGMGEEEDDTSRKEIFDLIESMKRENQK